MQEKNIIKSKETVDLKNKIAKKSTKMHKEKKQKILTRMTNMS
jgi:hypothetical protein